MSFKPHALVLADFYKTGHPTMMPEGLTRLYSNFTPRSNRLAPAAVSEDTSQKIDRIVFWKLQALIKEWLIDYFNEEFFKKSKEEVVAEYCRINDTALGPGTVLPDHIAALHDLGYLPLRIKALPEGSLVDMKVAPFTVVNTHDDFGWLAGRLEDLLSCELWKGITAATIAFEFRKMLEKYADLTGSPKDFVMWQGHDFSLRGLGGMMSGSANQAGHLLSFFGTDTIPSILYLEKYYSGKDTFVGGSVPASEHSVAGANILLVKRALETKGEYKGEKLEDQPQHLSTLAQAERIFLKNYITKIVPTGVASYVGDTFSFWSLTTEIVPTLKDEILNRQPNALGLAKVVFRPDSGDPVKILTGYKVSAAQSYDKPGYATAKEAIDDAPYNLVDAEAVKIGDTWYPCTWLNESDFEVDTTTTLSVPEVKGAVECLWDIFGGTETSKGFKVLNERVGLIYGDSITLGRGEEIMRRLMEKGFASCNVVFGIGSYTYEYNTRDTFGFAMKGTWCVIDGEALDIYKDPATDSGVKKSAKGLLRIEKENGRFVQYDQQTPEQEAQGELKVVFEDGKLVKEYTLEEVRANLASYL
ncbi:MAG TPA: nicotinate phosphoribosyltransferase [Methanosarcina sp.]|nr:nicotinate phosphoribosyltransferase [Methanosarcina sp.]